MFFYDILHYCIFFAIYLIFGIIFFVYIVKKKVKLIFYCIVLFFYIFLVDLYFVLSSNSFTNLLFYILCLSKLYISIFNYLDISTNSFFCILLLFHGSLLSSIVCYCLPYSFIYSLFHTLEVFAKYSSYLFFFNLVSLLLTTSDYLSVIIPCLCKWSSDMSE